MPIWKKRIQDKINKARKEIGHLFEYFREKGNVSKRVMNGGRSVARRLQLRMSSKNSDRRLGEEDERLRQRIAALGARIRRCEESSKSTTFAPDQGKV